MAICQTSKNTSAGGALWAYPKDTVSNFNASFQQLQHAVPQLLLCNVLIACEPLIPLAAGPLLPHLLLLLLLLHPRPNLPQLLQVLGALEQAQVAVQTHQVCGIVGGLSVPAVTVHVAKAAPVLLSLIPLRILFFGHAY
eukprot:1147073-Pelagomonas_calceolata.AAC.1